MFYRRSHSVRLSRRSHRRAQALLETPKAKHWQKLLSWPLFPGSDIWVSISDPQELTEVAKTGSNSGCRPHLLTVPASRHER